MPRRNGFEERIGTTDVTISILPHDATKSVMAMLFTT